MSDNVAHALAGAGGGIISMAVTYPLLTVGTRLQVQRNNNDETAYIGNMDALRKILSQEGIAGLFSGLESAVFGAAVTNGVYYYFFEAVKAAFERASKRKSMSTVESMISGAIAGSMTCIITNPIWVVNTRLTVKQKRQRAVTNGASDSDSQKEATPSTLQAFTEIIKEDGVLSLWQGLIPALILVINPIIQYTAFEQLKNRIERIRKLGSLDFFLLGAISKLCATGVTYPYVLIKSRMQLKQSKNENERYTSLVDGLRKVIAQEGIAGLYKGIESKLVQSMLTASLLFMSKEALFTYTVKLLLLIGARKSLANAV
ncbi:mitochondrial carrier [Coemansia reversa NRRL 1564]|uniref:Mitochondrial carrier n=1 Tax=Coemansia reversa (strain ATCC 12441 / NRRL 1564) TaxID=763665 RepID=A0A2G5B870_COERN|nr:mitochondrial carrier [Coemansia reversa NRRL 1564]|eukprot:PIA15233.1 mitochondrial carrier [Coemansia reversa NRRL 1564]